MCNQNAAPAGSWFCGDCWSETVLTENGLCGLCGSHFANIWWRDYEPEPAASGSQDPLPTDPDK